MYDNFQKRKRPNIAFLWSNWPILVAFILFYQIIAKTVHFILNVYFEYVLRSKHEKYFVLYVMNQIWSIKNRIKNDLIMLLVFHRLLRPFVYIKSLAIQLLLYQYVIGYFSCLIEHQLCRLAPSHQQFS